MHGEMVPSPICRVFLLGEFGMEWAMPSLDPAAWESRPSARALFLLLLCAPNRRAFRSKLAGLLWPETEEEHALDSLRSALKVLRRVVTTGDGQTLLEACGVGEIRLEGQERLWIDADALLHLVQQASTATTPEEALPLWQEADALQRGGFLQGDVDQEWANCLWVQERRQALSVARRQVVRYLSQSYLRTGQRARAEVLLTAHLMQFPSDQDALYRLMKLLIQAECFREALSAYKYCQQALEERGKAPAPALQKLAQDLRSLDLTRAIHQPSHLDEPAPIVPQAAVDLIVIPSSLAPTLPQEALLPFSNAIKQGILDAARELEGASHLDLSRRTLLQQVVSITGTTALLPGILASMAGHDRPLAASPQSYAPGKLAPETLASFAALTEICRRLSDGKELKLAEQILWSYLPEVVKIAQVASEHQRTAVGIATQGYLLAASLAGHNDDLQARQRLSEQALLYGDLAQNRILLVSALRQLALTFDYLGYPDRVLQTYQQTFHSLNDVPPLLRSCIYAGVSGAHAQLHQKHEADRFLHLAYEHFPEKEEEAPGFLHITCRYSSLIFWEGLNHLAFHQPNEAERVFACIDGLQPRIVIPERVRAELLNYQAETFCLLRDLEQACAYLEAAVKAAVDIGSKIRFQEALSVFRQLWGVWRNELRVQGLVDLLVQASHDPALR